MSNAPIERSQLIGPRKALVGVLTEAAAGQGPARPMVVILNSGIIHRVGPNRLSVLLARALASQGHAVLRFDLSGIGDSEARVDALAPLDAALADIREVLDWAEAQLGVTRFILVGLCSGADHAVIYSGGDARVSGLVLMDSTVPPTLRFHVRRVLGRLVDPQLWRRVLVGDAKTWARALGLRRRGVEEMPPRSPDPGQAEVRRYLENAYRQALAESRELLAVFTDGLPARHNYARQLRDAFPGVSFEGQLRIEYFHGADHTFTEETRRDELIGLVTGWTRTTAFRVLLTCCVAAGLGVDCAELVLA